MNATLMEQIVNESTSIENVVPTQRYQQNELNADILSEESTRIFEVINFVCVCGLISLLGITANLINIVVFYKQGFTNTVNITFFALAISDLCCLITLLWVSFCLNPHILHKQLWNRLEVMYCSVAWPHLCFCRITSFLTVYITAERWICILHPLKVKQIVTPRKTIIIICIIYIINLLTLVPEYSTTYLDWKSVPGANRTILRLVFSSSRKNVEGLCYVLHSMLGMSSFLAVIFFTIVLGAKLAETSKWRTKATSSGDQRDSVSSRDKGTMKMIVLIASILIACYTPGAVAAMASFIIGPDFDIRGRYGNICEVIWSFVFPIEALNSSINIFLYYSMSSKYRYTLRHVLFWYVKGVELE